MATNILNKAWDWISNHSATILSWAGTVGTIVTPILAVKATDNARGRIHDAYVDKIEKRLNEDGTDIMDAADVELTTWEKFKAAAPAYIPTAIVEAATIGCIHGSNLINKSEIRKVNAALEKANITAMTTMAAFSTYAESVGQITDRTTEYAAMKRVEKQAESQQNGEPPWDEVRTFYVEGQPEFFERTMEQVFHAEYEINRFFAGTGTATLNDFYRLLDLPETEYGKDHGWNDYIGEVYFDYHWIDFSHHAYLNEDGMYITEIKIPFGPHALDEDAVNAELDDAIANGTRPVCPEFYK